MATSQSSAARHRRSALGFAVVALSLFALVEFALPAVGAFSLNDLWVRWSVVVLICLFGVVGISRAGRTGNGQRDKDLGKQVRRLRERAEFSEQRLSDFIEAASDLFWETDAEMRFTYVSPHVHHLFGVEPDFAIGKTRHELGGRNEDPAKDKKHSDTVAAREPYRDFDISMTLPSGKQVHLRVSGKPVFASSDEGGAFLGYRGVARDISDLVNARSALRISEEAYRQLIGSLPSGHFFYARTDKGGLNYVSPTVSSILGYTPDSMPKTFGELLTDSPMNSASMDQMYRVTRMNRSFSFAVEVRHADGSTRTLGIVENPVVDSSGKAVSVQGIAREVAG